MAYQFRTLLCISFLAVACATASARSPQQREIEITKANWVGHPKIKIIRQIVATTNSGLKRRVLKTAERRLQNCDGAFFNWRRIGRDSRGAVLWYGDYGEGEDSSWNYQRYYDSSGHLRFVFVTVNAANGSRQQHRYYFDEAGKLIWNDRKTLKGPGYFAPHDIERLVGEDPAKAFLANDGCEEIK